MRRFLPVALCAASAIVLPACDQAPEGPSTDAEQALYEFRSGGANAGDDYAGNGDITVETRRGDDDDDDLVIVDLLGATARNSNGDIIQTFVADSTIADPAGTTLCTTTVSDDGMFTQLRDTDGTVLMSVMGKRVFDGAPQLTGKNPGQQLQELNATLRYTFKNDRIVEGHPGIGDDMAEASAAVQHASNFRKLVLASELEGYCGGVGVD